MSEIPDYTLDHALDASASSVEIVSGSDDGERELQWPPTPRHRQWMSSLRTRYSSITAARAEERVLVTENGISDNNQVNLPDASDTNSVTEPESDDNPDQHQDAVAAIQPVAVGQKNHVGDMDSVTESESNDGDHPINTQDVAERVAVEKGGSPRDNDKPATQPRSVFSEYVKISSRGLLTVLQAVLLPILLM